MIWRMSVQVNVRLDDATVARIDGLTVIRGSTRPELIREAVEEWLRRRDAERIDEQYRRAYADDPRHGRRDGARRGERPQRRGRRAVAEVVVARGDVWWMELPDEKGRPVLVVSRDSAASSMRRVVVALVTRTLRAAPSQLPLGEAEGLNVDSVANFDDLMTVPKALLVRHLGTLGPRMHELCGTLRLMAGC